MVETLARKEMIYAFDKNNQPVKFVEPGTTIEVETSDCFENQIQSAETKLSKLDWNRINPATGPIFINGAQPGDVLKVTIEKLEIASQGVIATGADLGVMGHRFDELVAKMIPIENGYAIFNDKVKIPLQPMIGVIGVAPAEGAISCGTPGAHGGNMDTKLITEGVTLYFPVFVEGALFALGDFHAAMGDGEVCGTGIEIPGKATLTLDVIKSKALRHPLVVSDEGIAFIVTAETIDDAVKQAAEAAIDFLLPYTDLTLAEMTMLMSAAGEAQISQIVDPLMTARFFVPQYMLDAYQVKIFS